MGVEDLYNEIVERLTPKNKKYRVIVERTLRDEFIYELDAESKDHASILAEELAKDDDTFLSERNTYTTFINCLDLDEEVILTNHYQLSFTNIRVD